VKPEKSPTMAENYTVTFFINQTGWGLTFECEPQNQEALLRDFPTLRAVRDVFLAGRPLREAVQGSRRRRAARRIKAAA
jgi:hypothetical protein